MVRRDGPGKEAHDTEEKVGCDTHRSWRDIFGDGKKPLRPLRKFDADADNETDGAVEDSSAAVAAGTLSSSSAAAAAAAAAGEGYCNWDMKAARERDRERDRRRFGDEDAAEKEKREDAATPSWYKGCKAPCRPGQGNRLYSHKHIFAQLKA